MVVVNRSWNIQSEVHNSYLQSFLSCLSTCRNSLLKWSRNVFPNNLKVISELKARLAEYNQEPLTLKMKKNIADIKVEIESAFDREEQYWKQRSRIEWLRAGDKNSRFFHLSTIKRRHQNAILKLRDDAGNWLSESHDIAANISIFFQELFHSDGVREMDVALNFVDRKIDDQMNSQLERPITKEEIREAVFSLGSTKAPGPDGFSGKFYQSAWPEISESVCSMIFEFFAGDSELNVLNETNITLIPKIPKPEHVSHFRPIGLCNFAYKIISKIMANKMRSLMGFCISQNQSAFIPGRIIHDNIIIAHEVYHNLRRKKKSKKYEFALKMDMSKAYDRVE